jgi:hypothetical protein
VEMIFGLDAGWAVEGAVGSEYKIDATYLSPYVFLLFEPFTLRTFSSHSLFPF